MHSLDESVSTKFYSLIGTSKSFIGLLILSLISTLTAGFVFVQSFSVRDDIIIQKHGSDELVLAQITVDVSGEVKNPDVYTMAEGSRMGEVIQKAGGFTDEADSDYIAQAYNLARIVKDGEKIYIPGARSGEDHVLSARMGDAVPLVNINNADVKELDTLASVGKITAEKIIGGRPYTSIEELVEKEIVTKRVFEKIQSSITTY